MAPVALLPWVAGGNPSRLLFYKERQERLAHSCSFLKSNTSELLPLLFKKEQLSEEHKKGETLSKTYDHSFLRAMRSNHIQITDIALFERNWEQFARSWSLYCHERDLSKSLTVALLLRVTIVIRSRNGYSFLKSNENELLAVAILSKRAKSKRANSQPWVPVICFLLFILFIACRHFCIKRLGPVC